MAFFQIDNYNALQVLEFVRLDDLRLGMPLFTFLPDVGNTSAFDVSYLSQLGGIRSDSRDALFKSSESVQDFIYTTDILQGESFTPVFTQEGKVVGFLMPREVESQETSRILPAHFIMPLLSQLLKERSIARPYLGVRYVNLSVPSAQNVLIQTERASKGLLLYSREQPAVLRNSPAEKAGLREGDILLQMRTTPLETSWELSTLLIDYRSGDTVDFVILRDGEQRTLSVVLDTVSPL